MYIHLFIYCVYIYVYLRLLLYINFCLLSDDTILPSFHGPTYTTSLVSSILVLEYENPILVCLLFIQSAMCSTSHFSLILGFHILSLLVLLSIFLKILISVALSYLSIVVVVWGATFNA